jgi:hypothetical protein
VIRGLAVHYETKHRKSAGYGLTYCMVFKMKNLQERYKNDPVLLAFYQKRLLIPGWAGEVDTVESEFTASELRRKPALRKRWQVSKFTRKRKAISPAMVKRLTRWLIETPLVNVKSQYSGTVNKKVDAKKTNNIQGKQFNLLTTSEK